MLPEFPFSDIEFFLVRSTELILLSFAIYKLLDREKPDFKSPFVAIAIGVVLVIVTLITVLGGKPTIQSNPVFKEQRQNYQTPEPPPPKRQRLMLL